MATKPTKAQSTAIAAAADAAPELKPPRGVKADHATNGVIAAFKSAYVANKRSERELKVAKPLVDHAFAVLEADFIESDFGTVVLQQRAGATKVDWEKLARELVPAAKLEKHLARFTSIGEPGTALIAPPEWSLEAKS
jgi:cytochrome c biogenesis protein ResB